MSELDELIREAMGGAYKLPDGREFWIDHAAAREISRRVQIAIADKNRSFPAMLTDMTETMEAHSWWHTIVGTPLENDLPVRDAICALRLPTFGVGK